MAQKSCYILQNSLCTLLGAFRTDSGATTSAAPYHTDGPDWQTASARTTRSPAHGGPVPFGDQGVWGTACPVPPRGPCGSSATAQTPHVFLAERWSWWKGQSESLHFCFHPSSPNCRVSKLIWVFRLVGFYCRFLKKSPVFMLQTTGLKSPDKFSKCFLQFAFALIHPSVLP